MYSMWSMRLMKHDFLPVPTRVDGEWGGAVEFGPIWWCAITIRSGGAHRPRLDRGQSPKFNSSLPSYHSASDQSQTDFSPAKGTFPSGSRSLTSPHTAPLCATLSEMTAAPAPVVWTPPPGQEDYYNTPAPQDAFYTVHQVILPWLPAKDPTYGRGALPRSPAELAIRDNYPHWDGKVLTGAKKGDEWVAFQVWEPKEGVKNNGKPNAFLGTAGP